MRAFFEAIARLLKGILGIVTAPIRWVSNFFEGFGGGSVDPQDEAAAVAQRAAAQEEAKNAVVAPKPEVLDDAATVKRVAGRLLLGKPISPQTRISPSMLDVLQTAPREILQSLSHADADTLHAFISGHRAAYVQVPKVAPAAPSLMAAEKQANFAARVAARERRIYSGHTPENVTNATGYCA